MIEQTVRQLAGYADAVVIGEGDRSITSITTDSRKACQGSLFACIKGEKTDGHHYIGQAVNNGALAVLCEKMPKEDLSVPCILTDSTIGALGKMAAKILEQAKIPVTAVAGSVGKTSTKEMIASVLAQKYRLLKTEANFNNELGLPLTIFNLEQEHEAAVLELGIDDFGQMHQLAQIAKPDICVFTNIGDCHLEQLGDREGVWRAKSEMIDHMKENGHIILNGDDEILCRQKIIRGTVPVFYGIGSGNDVRACNIVRKGAEGSSFDIVSSTQRIPVRLSQAGDHNILNALAAAAVGSILGLSADQIRCGIESYETISGRFKITDTGYFTVIDDCYNANPMSMKAALLSLSRISGRKIAVLGDMGELGKDAVRFHYEVGWTAGKLPIDAVFCAGELSGSIINGLQDACAEGNGEGSRIQTEHFQNREELTEKLPSLLQKGDVILVKASHFMEFGKIVEMLKEQK